MATRYGCPLCPIMTYILGSVWFWASTGASPLQFVYELA